ncbi:MAG: type II toxin-antitoxin system Phd/YefM family antitoxin [Acidobacteria bacterium]|nr:type II toxin-antitoxin system Phd/YefM family antitoxin [Acidobacteriota bacterium]
MAKTVPVRELRAELAGLLDQVTDLREHVIVTRRGRPAAAIVPIDEYEALEETAEILSDAQALADIRRGRADLKAGRTHTLDEIRAEHAKRLRRS